MTRGGVFVVALFAASAAAGVVAYRQSRPWIPTVAAADRVAAVEIEYDGVYDYRSDVLARSTDSAAVRAFLAALEPADDILSHACIVHGRIRIHRDDGAMAVLLYRPGHDPAFYEVVVGDQWRKVPRPAFVAAVKGLGATRFPLDCAKPAQPLP